MTPDTKALSELVERLRTLGGHHAMSAQEARGGSYAHQYHTAYAQDCFAAAALLSSLSPELAGSNDHG